MEKLVKKFIENPISGENILQICNNEANLVVNSTLYQYKNIDEVLGKYGACIIFYDKKDDDIGHWSCIIRNGKFLEFFDPYSLDIDEPLQFTEGKSYLKDLCWKSPYFLTYNPYPIQKYKKNVSTCGRFCGLRILLRDMNIHAFANLFTSNKNYDPDFWATCITMFCDN